KMAARIPGSQATNQSITLEAGLISDIRRAQTLERDSLRNPSGVNRISSTTDDDSASFEGRVTFPINIATEASGNITISAIDYFTVPANGEPHYTAGSGGTVKSSTLQGAIIEQTVLLKKLELDPTKNTTNANYITWSISTNTVTGLGNGTFTANYTNMPLEVSIASNGAQTTTGKAYLL
ncbi:MAG: hypothetical protein ACRDB1_04095, partial [Microcoleaceae cyanobacterium]